MTDAPRLSVQTGKGRAFPVFAHDVAPSRFDDAIGATSARVAWETANARGDEAYAAEVKARRAWDAEHPRPGDDDRRTAWTMAREDALKPYEDAVAACEKRAAAALRAYVKAQREGAEGRDLASEGEALARAADARVNALLGDLRKALADRRAGANLAGDRVHLRTYLSRGQGAAFLYNAGLSDIDQSLAEGRG